MQRKTEYATSRKHKHLDLNQYEQQEWHVTLWHEAKWPFKPTETETTKLQNGNVK